MEPHSCPRCSWLVLNSTSGHSPYPEVNEQYNRRWDKGYSAQDKPTNFTKKYGAMEFEFEWPIEYNAETGECALLQLFLEQIQEELSHVPNDITIDYFLDGTLHGQIMNFTSWWSFWLNPTARRVHIDNIRGLQFMLFTEADDSCNEWLHELPLNNQPETEAAFDLAKSWIKECENGHVTHHTKSSTVPLENNTRPREASPLLPTQQTHLHANAQEHSLEPTYRPTRLLHIQAQGSRYQVSLSSYKNESPEIVPYTALSYCWGGDQPFKTTRANLADHGGRLDYDLLPATLRDACRVTLKLGYCYLWIDSLCIVQDDPLEVQQEIAKMPLIYSNAVVVIAASRAQSSTEGFLHAREFKRIFSLPLRAMGKNDTIGQVRLAAENDVDVDPRHGNQPLDYRAWALQESLLASRVLEYGDFNTRFFCNCIHVKETERYKFDGWRNRVSQPHLNPIAPHMPASFPDAESKERYWWELVQVYTRRMLSVPTDRPLAISGFAERMAQIWPSVREADNHYIAGHWRSDLERSLNWWADHEGPKEYQGPSWSWLSVFCSVNSLFDFSCEGLIRVLQVHTRLKEPSAPYGMVSYAILTVQAYIIPVRVELINGKRRIYSDKRHDDVMWLENANICLDREDDNFQDAYLMQLYRDQGNDERLPELHVLLLQERPRTGVKRRFARIGWCAQQNNPRKFEFNPRGFNTWLDSWDKEIIELE